MARATEVRRLDEWSGFGPGPLAEGLLESAYPRVELVDLVLRIGALRCAGLCSTARLLRERSASVVSAGARHTFSAVRAEFEAEWHGHHPRACVPRRGY